MHYCLRFRNITSPVTTLVILCKLAEKVEQFLQIFAPCHKCVLSLILYLFSDAMIFELVAHNNSLLSCQVNISAHPGFVLSILHNGDKIHKSGCWESACNLAAQPYIMLSGTISLTLGGKYECQLHLIQHLITKKVYTSIMSGNSITLTLTLTLHLDPLGYVTDQNSFLSLPCTVLMMRRFCLLLRRDWI